MNPTNKSGEQRFPESKPDWLAQMEGILETLNEGVLILDDCDAIQFANEVFLEMTGARPEALLGRTPSSIFTGDDLRFLATQRARAIAEGRNRFEYVLPRTDGTRLPVIVSVRVVEDPDGREFAVITFADISEQKRNHEELRQANLLLEERQREIEQELTLAVRVQQSLVPRAIRWGRLAVETYYQPVGNIGGDFGVVAPADESHLNVMVCDVSGHGIGSALMANRIYSEAMSLLERRVASGEMLRRLNDFVLQIGLSGFYFTMALARIEQHGSHLHYSAAGHPPALWVPRSGECRVLESQSTVLGLLPGAIGEKHSEEIDLAAGDRLIFYTDGITEAFDARDELLGVEGLRQIVTQHNALPLPELKDAILDEVVRWRHGPATDDMSLVLVEVS